MKKEYYYCDLYSEPLIELLNKNNVKYEILDYGTLVPKKIRFTVMEGHPIIALFPDYSTTEPLITCVYSEKELLEAEYLEFRPIRLAIDIINPEEAFECPCTWVSDSGTIHYGHITQKGMLTIASFRGSEKTYFFHESAGVSFLFARKSAADVLKNNNITGIQYWPVHQKTRRKELIESNFYQLVSDHIINTDCICLDEVERIIHCPVCGKEQYLLSPGYQLKLYSEKLTLNQDFYMTEPVFGAGIPMPVFFVSQRIYRLLKEQHFDKNVIFEPVKLI